MLCYFFAIPVLVAQSQAGSNSMSLRTLSLNLDFDPKQQPEASLEEMAVFLSNTLKETGYPDVVVLQSEGQVAKKALMDDDMLKSEYVGIVSWPRQSETNRDEMTRIPYKVDYRENNETYSTAILSKYPIVFIDDPGKAVTIWLPSIKLHAVIFAVQLSFHPYIMEEPNWSIIKEDINEVIMNPEPGHTPSLEVFEWRTNHREPVRGDMTFKRLQYCLSRLTIPSPRAPGEMRYDYDNAPGGMAAVVIAAGGFNEASELDWTRRAWENELSPMYVDSLGLPVSTLYLHDLGMTDGFRAIYPNELERRGYTWPTHKNDSIRPDRIDMIYYKCGESNSTTSQYNCSAVEVNVVGDSVENNNTDIMITPWLSEHRGVLLTLELSVTGVPGSTSAMPTRRPTSSWGPTVSPTATKYPTCAPTKRPTLPPGMEEVAGNGDETRHKSGYIGLQGVFTFTFDRNRCRERADIHQELWNEITGVLDPSWIRIGANAGSNGDSDGKDSKDDDADMNSGGNSRVANSSVLSDDLCNTTNSVFSFEITCKEDAMKNCLQAFNTLSSNEFYVGNFRIKYGIPALVIKASFTEATHFESEDEGHALDSEDKQSKYLFLLVIIGLLALVVATCSSLIWYWRLKQRARVMQWLPNGSRRRRFHGDLNHDENFGETALDSFGEAALDGLPQGTDLGPGFESADEAELNGDGSDEPLELSSILRNE